VGHRRTSICEEPGTPPGLVPSRREPGSCGG
jgi:hypothetical protein